ncbi:MAG: phosphoenolpyruvate synthase, partial [Candidatus Aenigmarchaeota archaeon]|nr:phosphoenolpyruvate synthase [Candidatus Aenigmarchaeota archaeon]
MNYKAERRKTDGRRRRHSLASYVLPFSKIRIKDVPLVGGKTASLGEMLSLGLPVPDGFAVTADAYKLFVRENNLDGKIKEIIRRSDLKKIRELKKAGRDIRSLIKNSSFPVELEKQILNSYRSLGSRFVAVRSSATAEDLPDASFAGEQESYLNVDEKHLMSRIRDCFASLFTDRAISYREDKHFDHFKVYLSVAVEKQVFSKASGVMFTIDPDSGHRNFIVINSSYGLGDYIVQGRVTPDEFWIFKKNGKLVEKRLGKKDVMEIRSIFGVKQKKVSQGMQKTFSLSDKEAGQLAEYGKRIEKHYGRAMDIEWAKDDKIYIIQARPVTVHAKKTNFYEEFSLKEKGTLLAEGAAVGRKIASGRINVIRNVKDIGKFRKGEVLVTTATDPDWEPIMKIASGIITEEGGRTSHAAIVSRELGIPAIVGSPGATKKLKGVVTIDCSGEKGKIWTGALKFEKRIHDIKK